MRSRTLIILFCSLAVVHLATQLVVAYVWAQACGQDAEHFHPVVFLFDGYYVIAATFPGCLAFGVLPMPESLLGMRLLFGTILVLNSALWSGVICALAYLCCRLFRSRPLHVA